MPTRDFLDQDPRSNCDDQFFLLTMAIQPSFATRKQRGAPPCMEGFTSVARQPAEADPTSITTIPRGLGHYTNYRVAMVSISVLSGSGDIKEDRMKKKVLHIVPNRFFRDDMRMLGSTKDMFGRVQFFYDKGIEFDIFAHVKNRVSLSDDLSFQELDSYSHIIVEHTYGSKDFEYIKSRWPNASLIVRSHQSEILHRHEYLTAVREIKAGPRAEREAMRSLQIYQDREEGAARFADVILSIEPNESENYWRSLGFSGRFLFTPYFLPSTYLQKSSCGTQQRQRKNQIVCIGSSHPGPLILAMIQAFEQAVSRLEPSTLPDWTFVITGPTPNDPGLRVNLDCRFKHLGAVDDLFSLLRESRAVALMSALGRGFKTKVLDATMSGTWVIVPPDLYLRLPEPVRPFCIILSQEREAIAEAVAQLEEREWPSQDPNEALRCLAYDALENALS